MLTAATHHACFAALLCLMPTAAGAAQPPTPVKQPPFPLNNPDCFSYRTSLPGQKFYFDSKNIIYSLVNTGIRSKINFEIPLYKHIVIKINMNDNNLIIIKELTADMPAGVLFFPFGNPPNDWSGVLFEGSAHECRYGKARFFRSSPHRNKKISAYEKTIALVSSTKNPRPFDLGSRYMMSMDVRRLQFRRLRRNVPLGEVPIYSDERRRLFFTFAESPSFRGIIDRSTLSERRLAFPPGSRVLQQRSAFALSSVNRATNTMEIEEYPKWSGAKARKKRYRLQLPSFYSLVESQVVVDMRKKIVAIGGASLLAKRKWRKVFFIDYRRGKQLAVLNVEEHLLADSVAVDPFGLYMAINVVRETDGKTAYLALFDLSKRKLRKVALRPVARRKNTQPPRR